jgi:hypothetical protein
MEKTSLEQIIWQVLVDSAPEREGELSAIWHELNPIVQLLADVHVGERIVFDAGAYRYVRFNHRVMRAFWIAGFAAWEAYRSVARSSKLGLDTAQFDQLLTAFEKVISDEDPTLAPLPQGVAEPGQYPDVEEDPEGRAASELATIGVAWALLHELRHIQHQRDGTGAKPFVVGRYEYHREEFSCDDFATSYLLERTQDYADSQCVSVELVRQKRQLGIYFGLFAVSLIAKDKWQATDTHPSVQERIDSVRNQMAGEKSEIAAAIAHVAFATLRQR